MIPVVTEVQDSTAIRSVSGIRRPKELICGRPKLIRLGKFEILPPVSALSNLEYQRQIPYSLDTMLRLGVALLKKQVGVDEQCLPRVKRYTF